MIAGPTRPLSSAAVEIAKTALITAAIVVATYLLLGLTPKLVDPAVLCVGVAAVGLVIAGRHGDDQAPDEG